MKQSISYSMVLSPDIECSTTGETSEMYFNQSFSTNFRLVAFIEAPVSNKI